MSCERCKTLEGFLQRARKEHAALKDLHARAVKRGTDRKKLLDAVVSGQTDAAAAVEHAVSAIINHLLSVTKPVGEVHQYVQSHSQKIRNVARVALDTYQRDNAAHQAVANRKRSEHAMPRHGRYSS